MAEKKSFFGFLSKLIESPANFRVSASQFSSVRHFLRREIINEKTGEVFNSSDLRVLLDMDKIDQYMATMGFYQIVTSELTMHPLEVIDKYHGLSRIEDQFRVMKGDLQTRPIFVRTPEHIKAHLLICTIALIILRIIQSRTVESGLVPSPSEKNVSWTSGLSAERIQKALLKWQVEEMPGDYFRFLSTDDPDLKIILQAFGLSIPYKLFRRSELRQLKTQVKVFM